MLYRVHLNQRKKYRREMAVLPLADGHEPDSGAAPRGLTVELREIAVAIDGLPDDQRAALLLVVLEGTDYDEAAWILDIPVGTLRYAPGVAVLACAVLIGWLAGQPADRPLERFADRMAAFLAGDGDAAPPVPRQQCVRCLSPAARRASPRSARSW